MRLHKTIVAAICLFPALFAAVCALRHDRPGVTQADDTWLLAPLRPEGASSVLALARLEPMAPGHGKAMNAAFVADGDESAIVAFDLDRHAPLARTQVGGRVSQLLLLRSGHVVATLSDENTAVVLGPGARRGELRKLATLETATEPLGMALTPDESVLLIVCGWGHRLQAFSTTSWREVLSVDLPREPRAVLVDDAGERAFVAHAVGSTLSVVRLADLANTDLPRLTSTSIEGREVPGGRVALDETMFGFWSLTSLGGSKSAEGTKAAPRPRVGVQGYSLAKMHAGDAELVFMPEVLADPGAVDTPEERPTVYGRPVGGPGFSPEVTSVAVIDAKSATVRGASLAVTRDERRCLLPRAALVDEPHGALFVACLGTNQIVEYDASQPNPVEAMRNTWDVPSGPTGLALDDAAHLVVWSAFDRVLTLIDRAAPQSFVTISPTAPRAPTPFEVGRKLFHASGDPRICSDGRTCASCHPDGRDDGLVWASPEGNRQTPMLAGRLARTAPYGWSGASATVRTHLHRTMERLNGRGLDGLASYALLTYLEKMPVPRPRAARALHEQASLARGEALFRSYEVGCGSCHAPGGSGFTDGEQHDIGSGTKVDLTAELNTPSLLFVGGTGPYFHDGRYASLDALLRATDGAMGNTAQLDGEERQDLMNYVESL